MHPPRFSIASLLLIVAAFGVALAALKGNHVWFQGITIMTVLGLVGAAIGASPEPSRAAPTLPESPLRIPPI
jgi:uncharacterized membrane protein YfcA